MSLAIASLVFGLVSLIIAMIISSAQAFIVFKTKNTSGTSLLTYVIMLICATVCLIGGVLFYFSRMSDGFAPENEIPLGMCQGAVIPIILVYIFDIYSASVIIFIKRKHIKLCEKLHMNELQLSTYLLKQQNKKSAQSSHKIGNCKYFGLIMFFAIGIILIVTVATCGFIFTNPYFVPSIPDISPDEESMRPYIITVSVLGAATGEAISGPQFVKCIRTRDTSGISFAGSIFLPVACVLSLSYSITLAFGGEGGSWNTIGAILFNGILVNVGILIIKLKNRKAARARNMTEIEYTQKYLLKHKKQKRA